MVCWLALCLGRKVEERLGKKYKRKGRKGTEEEGRKEEGQSLKNCNNFIYTHIIEFLLNAYSFLT